MNVNVTRGESAGIAGKAQEATIQQSGDHLNAAFLDDVIEWDVLNWSRCLIFWLPVLRTLRPGVDRVLTIGERNGGLSLWFACQGFQVVCSDFGGVTARPRELHARYGVSHLISYADVNVFSMPYSDGAFEVVACKSVIGGLKLVPRDAGTRTLENQQLAVREILRVLRPSGYFLGAENLRSTCMHQRLRSWMKKGRVGWRHLSNADVCRLFSKFTLVEAQAYGFVGTGFAPHWINHVTARADAFLSAWLPKDWLYISFIRARR